MFTSTLSFTFHINDIVAKAKQRLYLLKSVLLACTDILMIHAFKIYTYPPFSILLSGYGPPIHYLKYYVSNLFRDLLQNIAELSWPFV